MAQCPVERSSIEGFECHKEGFDAPVEGAVHMPFFGNDEKTRAEHRRQRQRDKQRDKYAEGDDDGKGAEELPDDAADEDDRGEDGDQ